MKCNNQFCGDYRPGYPNNCNWINPYDRNCLGKPKDEICIWSREFERDYDYYWNTQCNRVYFELGHLISKEQMNEQDYFFCSGCGMKIIVKE